MKKYIYRLHEMLKDNVEPDIEDIYLADIEAKAIDYEKYKQALNEIRELASNNSNYNDGDFEAGVFQEDILQIIDKVGGN